MKIINKIVSLTLILCMSLIMLEPMVNAAKLSETGTITVEGVENDVTVSAYRLMNVNVDTTVNQPKDPVYSWIPVVQTWINNNYPDFSDANDFNEPNVSSKKIDIELFYDKLSAAIKTGNISVPAEKTITGNGNIDGLAMGNYLIIIENGMKVYRPSAVNLVPEYDTATQQWKISEPRIVVKSSDAGVTKVADNKTPNIGDIVTYTVEIDIPQYPANAKNKNYIFSDNMSEGLTFQADSLVIRGVKVAGASESEWETIPTSAYTLTTEGVKLVSNTNVDVDFQVQFNYGAIKQYEKLVIVYTAKVNEKAVVGSTGNSNIGYLEYNNNPYGTTDYKEKDITETVYTYGLDVTKVGDKESDKDGLAGAEFELSKENNKDTYTAIAFVEEGEAGHYRLAMPGETNTVTTLVVDENGKLYLTGLGTGTYYFHETKAPGGYNKPNELFEVTITDDDENGKPTVAGSEIESGYVTLTIENNSGFRLPETGGIGTILFTVGGIVLMGLGVLIIKNIRKKENN